MRRNSSKINRRLAAASSAIESGRWMARKRGGAIEEIDRGRESSVERIGETALAALRERVGDERAQLPREHLGLARLRVHRDDHAGLLVGRTRAADDVDNGVRHLALSPVHVELAEERRLGADAQLLLAPRLVEERDVEQRRAVVDDDLDQRAALARAPAVDGANLGEDRRLLPHFSSAMSIFFVRSTQRRG